MDVPGLTCCNQAPDARGSGVDTHRQQRWLRVVHIALQELKDALLEVLIGEVFDLWMRGILLLDDSQPLILLLLGERFIRSGKNTLGKGISDNTARMWARTGPFLSGILQAQPGTTEIRPGKGQRNRRVTKEQQSHLISGILLACSAQAPQCLQKQEWELQLLPEPALKVS